jgi:ribA/ribD-fused uncharacterized protein
MVNVVEFKGEYRFLSNFWPAMVSGPGGRVYPTVEHAYQASKSLDPSVWSEVRALPGAGSAKNYGRHIDVRPDWNAVRLGIMESLLRQKFAPGSELAARLVAIDGTIEEGNSWGDTFWGISLHTFEGENHLGRLLMDIRDELRRGATA